MLKLILLAGEYGLDVMQLPTSSGKSKVVFVCPSSKNYWVQHFKVWAATSKDDKHADLDNKEVLVVLTPLSPTIELAELFFLLVTIIFLG